MARYIDADALKSYLTEREYADMYYIEALFGIIDRQPAISPDDLRSVVHCRECDLWNRWDSAGRESLGNLVCSCAHWTVEDGAVIRTKPTDFCSYGERMVSEDA